MSVIGFKSSVRARANRTHLVAANRHDCRWVYFQVVLRDFASDALSWAGVIWVFKRLQWHKTGFLVLDQLLCRPFVQSYPVSIEHMQSSFERRDRWTFDKGCIRIAFVHNGQPSVLWANKAVPFVVEAAWKFTCHGFFGVSRGQHELIMSH